jgi:exonuclease VII large subunit
MLNGLQHRLQNIEESIATLARTKLRSEQQRLESYMAIVENNNPETILRRGFAIVRDSNGRSVDMQNIEIGSDVTIETAQFKLTANVTSKHTKHRTK